MFCKKFLDTIHSTNAGTTIKIVNPELYTPLSFNSERFIVQHEPTYLLNITTFKSLVRELDTLFFELLLSSQRSSSFNALNLEANNLNRFFAQAIEEYQKDGIEASKLIILGNHSEELEEALIELALSLSYIEYYPVETLGNMCLILPMDVKIGSLIIQGKKKKRYGIVLYEQYLKKLISYSDDFLRQAVDQIIKSDEEGELE